ncbi:hypothetical protein PsorP6_005987 [Peronosclerospora sorghi]|uniref:Uncharacterized protein n=1 Tax=Peronosclerospora sorghi TaxID=230839 RepID=A0ACC0W333_9STRA|nr:hypothetical protein PsorP6_005987 [Peronosclerospora sorghi]
MTTEKRRQSIEVFCLRLRETVNEGDDGESIISPKNTPEDGVGHSELVVPLSSPNENGSDEKVEGEKEEEHFRPDERDFSRSGIKIGIEDDRERDKVASKFVHGDRHEKHSCKRLILTSSSCGDNCSSRTISYGLDAADLSSPLSIKELSIVAAKSDQMMESLEENKVVTGDEAEPGEATRGQSVSRSHSSSAALWKQEMGQSRRVGSGIMVGAGDELHDQVYGQAGAIPVERKKSTVGARVQAACASVTRNGSLSGKAGSERSSVDSFVLSTMS